MFGRRKDTEFLKWLIGYGGPEQCAELRHKLHDLQREEYCVRRMAVLMCVMLLIALSGFGYSVVFVPDWLGRTLPWMVRIFLALGVTAGVSLVACLGCWWRQRMKLEALHDDCRDLVRTVLFTRLNTSQTSEPQSENLRQFHLAS